MHEAASSAVAALLISSGADIHVKNNVSTTHMVTAEIYHSLHCENKPLLPCILYKNRSMPWYDRIFM